MIESFQGNALGHLLMQSDGMTKGILCILLGMSIMCWAIFLYKIVSFIIKRRSVGKALVCIKKMHTIDDLRKMTTEFSRTLPGYIIDKNVSFLRALLEMKALKESLTDHDLVVLEQKNEQTVFAVMYEEESYFSFLYGSAAVAPLLGLFGTIWGLMHSFMSISQTKQADIATIAPGLAEALVTTLAGLMVAIPAVVMFHYVSSQSRYLEQILYNLADQLLWVAQVHFTKK